MNSPRRIARRIADGELAVVALLAPFLLLPSLNYYLTAVAAALLIGIWIVRWIARGAITRRTPFDLFILVMLIMLPISLWASPLLVESVDAATRILWGIALYYALVNSIDSVRAMRIVMWLVLAGGVGIALLGLVSIDWSVGKIPLLNPIYDYLPNLSHLLGPLVAGDDSTPDAFHPNFVGATIAIALPTVATLFVVADGRFKRVVIVLSLVVMLFVLILTQSRLGIASLMIAIGVLCFLAFSRARRVILGVLAIAVLLFWIIGFERISALFVDNLAAQGFGSWDSRLTLWRTTLMVLLDFPFSGIGLAVFYPVATYLYAFDFSPTWKFGHVHETYLQMGVDFGLAGLLSFAVMIGLAVRKGWPTQGRGQALWWMRAGVWTSLLTYALFGLFDGLPLWTKSGFVIWVLLGLVAVGCRLATSSMGVVDGA